MGDRKEGFGKETEGVGAEEIEVGLDDGEVMIAEMSVDRGSETVVDGRCWEGLELPFKLLPCKG